MVTGLMPIDVVRLFFFFGKTKINLHYVGVLKDKRPNDHNSMQASRKKNVEFDCWDGLINK